MSGSSPNSKMGTSFGPSVCLLVIVPTLMFLTPPPTRLQRSGLSFQRTLSRRGTSQWSPGAVGATAPSSDVGENHPLHQRRQDREIRRHDRGRKDFGEFIRWACR